MPVDSSLRRPRRRYPAMIAVILSMVCLHACADTSVKSFVWTSGSSALSFSQSAGFPRGAEGVFTLGRSANRFIPQKPIEVDAPASLRVSVECALPGTGFELALSDRADGKETTITGSFALSGKTCHLHLPLDPGQKIASLAVRILPSTPQKTDSSSPGAKRPSSSRADDPALATIKTITVVPPFHGYSRSDDGSLAISRDFRSIHSPTALTLEFDLASGSNPLQTLPSVTAPDTALVDSLVLEYGKGKGQETIGIVHGAASWKLRTRASGDRIILPRALFPGSTPRVRIQVPPDFNLQASYSSPVPARSGAALDLGCILAMPFPQPIRADMPEDFALYRWNLEPSVLVFDFRDYAVQDAYLKRLAFFVEKRGYAGRLASDAEIADKHGWNAHDYRPEDLAAFYSLAASTGFPLNAKEERLRSLLLDTRIIVSQGGSSYGPGTGAIISITRESPAYLRSTFLVHESLHALFFADKAYREFAQSLWGDIGKDERWFWRLYFGWMNYNTASDYLMANEVQAYLLQQPVFRIDEYFGKTLPSRLLEHHPELGGPIDAYMRVYGASFRVRALRLEAWLRERYGILAGKSHFFS